MKTTVKKRNRLYFLPIFLPLLLLSCSLQPGDTGAYIDYDTRVVDYLLPVGAAGYYEPVITKVYDSDGTQAGEFLMEYDDNGNNIRTDVYEITDEGQKSLKEYYIYTYQTVHYTEPTLGIDEDITRVVKGQTFSPDNTLQVYYDVSYDSVFLDSYVSITDYVVNNGTPTNKALQICTYLKDTDLYSYGQYRTEQYFSWNSDTLSWDLTSEYACWYNTDGDYTAELYHVIRGSATDNVLPDNTPDDAYYYVPYSRNTQGWVYLQSDYLYQDTADGIPAANKQANGAFNVDYLAAAAAAGASGAADPFPYDITFPAIGTQVDMLLSDYDAADPPNIIKDTRFIYGEIQDITVYKYNSNNELTDQARYTQGGSVLDEKTVYRYRDETIDGNDYRIKETFTYTYGDSSSRSIGSGHPGEATGGRLFDRYSERLYKKVMGNHSR